MECALRGLSAMTEVQRVSRVPIFSHLLDDFFFACARLTHAFATGIPKAILELNEKEVRVHSSGAGDEHSLGDTRSLALANVDASAASATASAERALAQTPDRPVRFEQEELAEISVPFAWANSARLGTGRRRTHRRLHVDPVACLVEFVADLIVVIYGPGVDDFDEPSSRVVRVRDGFASRCSRSQETHGECGKSEFGRERHGVPPLMSRMFRNLASNARSFFRSRLAGPCSEEELAVGQSG
jgi:hypothetical protein